MSWQAARWERWEKHLPRPHVSWATLVQETGPASGEDAPATYHINLSEADLERIEMNCALEGRFIRLKGKNVWMFWAEQPDVIGASRGRETCLLYVEYHQNGEVHGRPITEEELRRKGAKV